MIAISRCQFVKDFLFLIFIKIDVRPNSLKANYQLTEEGNLKIFDTLIEIKPSVASLLEWLSERVHLIIT